MQKKIKKSLGQNFLIDENILKLIANSVHITHNDVLLEIGPGTGNLTKQLIKTNSKRIYVVEKDINLIEQLKKKFNDKIEIINEDILSFDEDKVSLKDMIIFGNLPYNISTQILIKFIFSNYYKKNIKNMIFMFQKEVADRILAKVNSREYGRISVITQLFFNVKKLKEINPESFYPKPKIKSTLLIFSPKKKIDPFKNLKNLETVTKIFFNQRRKKIKTPYKHLFKKTDTNLIKNINLDLRPQNLSPDDYINITIAYEKLIY